MTRLNTMVKAVLGLVLVLVASQAAVWIRMGEISGQLAELATRIH